ncbi:MAG: MarR family transcriptional regulator [Candidatus Omnitrophica bacterium]|nr:MarR family transcriptional regulator [Candidatus Omnitrophota bacterium]
MKPLRRYGIEVGKKNIFEGAIYGVAGMYALFEKVISSYLRPYNLTPAKFNTLMIIKHMGKKSGLRQIEIGRRLIVTASNMTHLIDKLEREGYVERVSLKGDRRVNIIKISKAGSDLLDKVWPGYHNTIQELANLMPQNELRQIKQLFDKWTTKLSEKNVANS